MDRAAICLLRGIAMSASTPTEKLRDLASIGGEMAIYTLASSMTAKKMDKGIGKRMAERIQTSTLERTRTIRSTASANSNGALEVDSKETMFTTRKQGTERCTGETEASTGDTGRTECRTALA